MGKSARNNKKKLLKLKKNTELSILSSEELLKNAQSSIEIFQYEKAQKFCQEALKRDADDLRALEVSATLCIELGNIEGAKHCLGRAISLVPDNGFTKYFSMGQLMGNKESLQCYKKGIELLNVCIKESQKENTIDTNGDIEKLNIKDSSEPSTSDHTATSKSIIANPLIRKLSNAYCSIAELFMSDLCDENEAEKESEAHSKKAIEIDCTNPEAYQQYANFLIIKENIEGARENIKKSVNLWLPQYLKVDDGLAAEGTFDPIEVCPLTESARFSCTRLLIEVGEHKLAADVLESLMGDNDEDVYTWYLIGWNYYLEGNETKPEAKYHLNRALQIHKNEPCEDAQIIDHIKELLEEMKNIEEPDYDTVEDLEDTFVGMDVS